MNAVSCGLQNQKYKMEYPLMDWSWLDFVSGDMDQIAWCGMFHELDMPCGCFDGDE